MKRAKIFPFSTLQKKRLQFFLDIQTQENIPEYALFFQWIWLTLKETYLAAEINLLIADEAIAQTFNLNYRGKNAATNVLSFGFNQEDTMITSKNSVLRGDLVMCPQVIKKEAKEQHKTLNAHYAHLTIHGVLHLMGFDHVDENEAIQMETLEIKLLHQLGYGNPYLEN